MDNRRLGKSDLSVSRLGWGTVKLGRNQAVKYPHAFDLPDEATCTRIVHEMLDLGITLLDTAPAYGLSQARLGAALGSRRDDVVLCSKVGESFCAQTAKSVWDFSAPRARATLHDSLRTLGTDHVDMLLIHGDGQDMDNQHDDLISTLQDLRSEGLTRSIGFSGKTPEGHQHALGWADVLMVPYGLHDTSHEDVIRQASQRGVGIVIKKAINSGHGDAEAALRFCWTDSPVAEGITSVVVGSVRPASMLANARVLSGE